MSWYPIDSWIVIVGLLAAGSCALLGNFLVLRRLSMLGDAISHSVLPGLAIAYMATETRTSVVLFLGAAIVGLLTAFMTESVSRLGKLDHGASLGIVFTSFFALGLILIVQGADHVDLDPSCVLYGAIELTPLDIVRSPEVAGRFFEVPRAVPLLAMVFLINLSFVVLFFKELSIASFDPQLARTMGLPVNRLHYGLMLLVALTSVAVFEVVGSIIVIAMLIVPPAAAYLLTERLSGMVFLSVILAFFSALLGHISALFVPRWFGFESTSTSGMMAVVAGLIFFLVLLFSPTHGLLIRQRRKKASRQES